jgi:hypothetical protein
MQRRRASNRAKERAKRLTGNVRRAAQKGEYLHKDAMEPLDPLNVGRLEAGAVPHCKPSVAANITCMLPQALLPWYRTLPRWAPRLRHTQWASKRRRCVLRFLALNSLGA